MMKKLLTTILCFALLIWPLAISAAVINQTANPAGVAAVSTVATYAGVSIGAEAADRIVAVVVGTELSASTPSAATIDYGSGDVAMTAGTTGNQGIMYARIFYLAVPTGTTATIKVTFSSVSPGSTANHIAVYSITGASGTFSNGDASTDMDATDPLTTGSITIPTNGGFIAISAGATDTVAKTWANATETIDDDVGTFRFGAATSTSAGTATITVTGATNGEDGALSYLIFTEDESFTSGPNSPGTLADDATVGTVAWVNTSNASATDNTNTTFTGGSAPGTHSHYLKATNFGFAIPTDATIYGIQMDVERSFTDVSGSSAINDGGVFCSGAAGGVKIVKGGTIGTTDMVTASTCTAWTTTDTYVTYGSSASLWGETWTPADINASTFGVVMNATGFTGGAAPVAKIDHIRMTVYYTAPDSGGVLNYQSIVWFD